LSQDDEKIVGGFIFFHDLVLFSGHMKLLSIKENQDNHDAEQKDTELVRRAQKGDRDAFEALIRGYQKRIFQMAYCFFREPEDAMEIVQETFLRVYKSIRGFKEGTRFQGWLYRVAVNLCIDYYRKFKKKRLKESEMAEVGERLHSQIPDPEIWLSKEMVNTRIQAAVAGLSKREKMVFLLKHFNDLKYREIAGIMNIAVGTVKSTHHRALSQVKKRVLALEKQ
jgi:RNA polymerase sigma-70 factor (ECF subfamily)